MHNICYHKVMPKEEIFIKKISNIINLILGLFVALVPLFMTLLALVGIEIDANQPMTLFAILYFIFLCFSSINIFISKTNRDKFIENIKKPIVIVAFALLLWIFIASCVNGIFNDYLLYYISYFLFFICVYLLDDKHFKILFNTMLIVVATSCILGMIDPMSQFIPGFRKYNYAFSIHFSNSNHSAYIACVLAIIIFNFFYNSKKVSAHIYYLILYVIFSMFLFLNGSYAPIFALFVVEIFQVIYLWIKLKKCPVKMLCLLLALIPLCFLSDLYQNIANIRTCQYNFFLESVAVFDNYFHTNLLDLFGIESIAGADGWDRGDLRNNSFAHIASSFKNFVFGSGAGYCYELAPHNVLICLWLDFGLFAPLLLITIFVLLFIKHCKLKFNALNFCYVSALICELIMMQFGQIFPCSFVYFILVVAQSSKDFNQQILID